MSKLLQLVFRFRSTLGLLANRERVRILYAHTRRKLRSPRRLSARIISGLLVTQVQFHDGAGGGCGGSYRREALA
jgi:hypothetical protein